MSRDPLKDIIMLTNRTRLAVAIAAAAVALSSCSSATKDGSTGTQNGSPTSAQTGSPASSQKPSSTPSVASGLGTKQALGDIKLGAIRIDAKQLTPLADVTITNHSSKRSNYIVDLSIMSPDGKTKLDAAMVSAPGLAPGQTARRAVQFRKTQTLPAGSKLSIVGVARLVA